MTVNQSMASEETPLLPQPTDVFDVYERFSRSKKIVILSIVSWSGLIPLFVAGSFIPAIPQIVEDLHSTASVINLAVSLSILTASLTSLFWATYSGFYGRRPIYLVSLPFLCLGSLGVANARNVPELMIFRVIQAFGSSAGMSVGSGAIADIYRLEERGTAMGIFFAASLLGPALAPLSGGVAAYYFTWRHMHYALFLAGIIGFTLMYFFLPETSHPGTRGQEKRHLEQQHCHHTGLATWHIVWLNPLKSLWLLRSPNLLAMTMIGTVILLADYVLLVPLAYTIGARYNITNEALIGAFFMPVGLGNFIGAPVAGRISDKIVVRCRRSRGGVWVPEDRLRGTLIGAAFLVPLSVLFSGLITSLPSEVLPDRVGIVLNLLCLFANGLGVDFVLSPSAAYCVDILHDRSAEIMAANNGLRGVILALATTIILPSVNVIGVFYTNLISAILAWMGAVLMWFTIRNGDRMRAWVDIGFSTIETT